MAHHLNKREFSPKDAWLKLALWFWGRKFLNFTNIFLLFHNKYDNNDDNNARENRILKLKQKELKRNGSLQNLFNFFLNVQFLISTCTKVKGTTNSKVSHELHLYINLTNKTNQPEIITYW